MGEKVEEPSVDPTLRLIAQRCRSGEFGGALTTSMLDQCDEGLAATVRFEGAIDEHRVERLADLGVELVRDDRGRLRHLGAVYRATISPAALEELSAIEGLIRAESLWQPWMTSPLEVTSERASVSSARLRPEIPLDGRDTRVAIIDTGIDVLHPSMFRADGGAYNWIDVNENGAFDPGVDAVDLDGDGRAGNAETLRVLDATTVTDFEQGEFENDDGVLDPRRDWLYADLNGDRERNVGVEAGFDEGDPAYGEAIFVIDDADRNGRLDPAEKLIRLETSKIRRYETRDRTYERGDDLIEAGQEVEEGTFHGTGSGGIVAAGQWPYHDRVGVAPGTELLVYGLGDRLIEKVERPLDFVESAVDEGADVLLHEWTNAFTPPLD
ncbi:MAG: S8 family serine peptidase, partial [Persicimonas sp.]